MARTEQRMRPLDVSQETAPVTTEWRYAGAFFIDMVLTFFLLGSLSVALIDPPQGGVSSHGLAMLLTIMLSGVYWVGMSLLFGRTLGQMLVGLEAGTEHS